MEPISDLYPVDFGGDEHRARAAVGFLQDIAARRFAVAGLSTNDDGGIIDLERRYEDLDAGLADLSAVLIADRYHTRRILTFDERRFRALRPLSGGHFTLLPADG